MEPTTAKGPLGWLERHGPLVLGIFAAIAAGWYLLTNGRGGAAPTALPLPQSSGGGGGASPSGGTASQPSGYLPYNPDTSVAGNLADKVLGGLYTQLANAEAAANVAYSEGNTALFNQWQTTVGLLQGQISGYQPATPATPTNPAVAPTPPASFTATLAKTWNDLGSNFYNRAGFGESTLGLTTSQAQDFAQRVHLYLSNGGAPTTDTLNGWLAETRAGNPLPTFGQRTIQAQPKPSGNLNISASGR